MKSLSPFTQDEIKILTSLYLEGSLSRKEEKALFKILSGQKSLPRECSSILKLMKTENKLFSPKNSHISGKRWYSSVAATILLACGIALPLSISHRNTEETFVVWQNGERITGEEARIIAEENQENDMEMLRQVMKQQREMMKRNFAVVNMEDFDL